MKKIFVGVLCFVLLIIIGILACVIFLDEGIVNTDKNLMKNSTAPATNSPVSERAVNGVSDNQQLLNQAFLVLDSIKARDFKRLATYIHPSKGVVFSPYSTVDLSAQSAFTPDQIKKAESDKDIYVWGIYDGEGSPIEMNIYDYFDEFVYNEDYIFAPAIGVNYILKTGNSLENVQEVFPDGKFVDFHFPELNPSYEGHDWCTLRVVFEEHEGALMVISLIHAQWTV